VGQVVVVEVNGYKIEPGADLTGADLTGANLLSANLLSANLFAAIMPDGTIHK
jgi:uncharacterized protein YjbI with pentapeptide repeats